MKRGAGHTDAILIIAFLIFVFLVSLYLGGVKMVHVMDRRIAVFESTLKMHAESISHHSGRMEKQDELLITLVGDVQRLVGRLETSSERRREARES